MKASRMRSDRRYIAWLVQQKRKRREAENPPEPPTPPENP